MFPWQPLLAFGALCELAVQLPELQLRGTTFAQARSFADARHKPLLNVGCAGPFSWHHGCGDVCVDLDVVKLSWCRSADPRVASVLALPFPDGYFGAATCFHVLEHLHSVDDVQTAISELERVADRVFVLVPGRNVLATLNADHHLWLDLAPGGYWVEDRTTGDRRFVSVRDSQTGTPSQLLSATAA